MRKREEGERERESERGRKKELIWVGRRTWVTSWKYAGVRRIKVIGEVEEIKERQRGSTKVNAGQLKSTAVKKKARSRQRRP